MNPTAQSLDIHEARIAQLQALFPEAFTEGKVDIKRLSAILDERAATGRENYELSWAGKADARAEIQKRTTATLRPDTANSVNWDATQNLYIEGENLEVLRTLQKAYFGKVKMIYIDPPYNTGNDSFVYPDDYSETLESYRDRTGQTDEAGYVNRQTLWKKNTKDNGRFHSVWLSMMYPRLFLARNLLRNDGVIFISIDDNEAANLKLLMDEIFGEENFSAQFVWKKKQGGGNDSKNIVVEHEYVLMYAKEIRNLNILLDKNHILDDALYPFRDDDGDYGLITLDKSSIGGGESLIYEIVGPDGEIYFPRIIKGKQSRWRWGREKVKKCYDQLIFKNRKIYTKYYRPVGIQPRSLFVDTRFGRTETGNEILSSLLGDVGQIYPKPHALIKHCISLISKNDLIFDFFSGSGTTAQAVLELNEEDGGNRQFICVQMPELLEENSEAYKVGYRTIADIGRARIKKVIERMEAKRQEADKQKPLLEDDENTQPQALGFNAFKLAPSNFKEWCTDIKNVDDLLAQLEYHVDSTRPDSEAGSMVYELLLKLALPLTTPIKCHDVGHGKVYMAKPESGQDVALFFEDLTDLMLAFIIQAQPVKVLCLNKCFIDSQALTNFSLQLQDAGMALEVL